MRIIKLSSKNQIVIPKEAREAMHVKAHDKIMVVVKDNIAIIAPKPKSHRIALSGIGKGIYKKDYLKTERSSW